ncbi:tripartite tricarboxylate transporter substrate-binding protein [Variovorax sp. 770b2]|uniref:Bug family tripartite tricarboxylate transporter substrate binding protein n=1 Tax=Variovorax sp. 770b2 TaxID=1566271 RepID=UPI0015A573A0
MARPDLEASTEPEVAALARKRRLTYVSWDTGSAGHLATVMFMKTTGLPAESGLHVPYPGATLAAQAVLASQGDLIFASVPMVVAQGGRLKSIALIHPKRVEAVPNIPTLPEQGVKVNMEWQFWMGMLAPPSTPDAVVDVLQASPSRRWGPRK